MHICKLWLVTVNCETETETETFSAKVRIKLAMIDLKICHRKLPLNGTGCFYYPESVCQTGRYTKGYRES